MKLLMISLFMGLFLNASAEKTPSTEKTPTDTKVVCAIEPVKKQFALGESPKFNFTVMNNSDKKILLVKILDGSSFKSREPQGYFEVTGPDGKIISGSRGRCGNTDPLKASDFVWIKAGEKVKLAEHGLSLWNGQFNKEGTYKIKFHYTTANDDFRKWVGGPMGPDGIKAVKKECGDLFKSRHKVSETLELEIEIVAKK